MRGNVQPGESVYVHAGASGISTAAIAVTLELGAIPYVGVFNKEQIGFLKTRFPQVCLEKYQTILFLVLDLGRVENGAYKPRYYSHACIYERVHCSLQKIRK